MTADPLSTPGQDSEGRTEALAALLSAEDTGLQNTGQISMALIGIIAAYVPVSLFAVYEGYGVQILAWLPLPVVLLMFFHMVQTAAMQRRARSAAVVEQALVSEAGLLADYRRGVLGTPARNPITDPLFIARNRGDRWLSRWTASILPIIGLYATGVVYTCYLCAEAARLNPAYPQRMWAVIVPIVLLLVLWSVFADSAMSYFIPRYKINIWVPAAGLTGIWLQATFPSLTSEPYMYFSLYSAALITIAALTRPWRLPWHDVVARAGIAGILVSSLGFWIGIVPRAGWGAAEEMVWANISMHVVAPVVTLAAVWYRREPLTPMPWRDVGLTMLFPLAYGVFVLIAHQGFDVPLPYSFLDPAEDGIGVTIVTCVLTVLIFFVVASIERFVLALRQSSVRTTEQLDSVDT